MFKLFNKKSESKPKAEPSVATRIPVTEAKAVKTASGILLKPLISEKTAHLGSLDTYGFVVNPKANKIQIAKAFAAMYNVKVSAVRVAIMPAKPKRTGRTWGVRSPWKKALIRVPKGSKVDVYAS